jgi:hypothetical protein
MTKKNRKLRRRIYIKLVGNAANCSLKSCTELNVYETMRSVVVFSISFLSIELIYTIDIRYFVMQIKNLYLI